MRPIIGVTLILALLTACEGPMGPQGPAGPQGVQGPAGPQGPAGESANYWFSQGFADSNGLYGVRFTDQHESGMIAQCWTREVSGPWVQLASAEDVSAPNGVVGCVKEQSGNDVIVTAVTYALWEVLVVAVASN